AWTKEAKLVVAIDIGTTCSAVSYVHLTTGGKPKVQRVTEWPGQTASGKECRLPSWIWYDADNKPVKYGAEAFKQDAEKADKQGFFLAKYFKLHLHPSDMAPASGFKLEPHPNGWGTREQGVLREAAVEAGWSTLGTSEQQIAFVSEAEASIQFCLDSSQTSSSLLPGMNLIVCDAGGSTVDTTVYEVTATHPILELQETKSSSCIQAGAIFVDDAFKSFMDWRVSMVDRKEGDLEGYKEEALENFMNFVKHDFDGTEETLDVKIGNKKLNIPSIDVHSGRLQLQG
ncbi:hypothetical protein FRC06_005550, partial [Ceratobasidium sp. 370]